MLCNPLASSSLPKREVWKCFKSSSHTTSQVLREIQSLPFSGLFAKFCGSYGSKRETLITSQKILRTEVRKVWRKCGFFMRLGPFFYDKRKASEDKIRCLF